MAENLTRPLVADALPELAGEIRALLAAADEERLAESVSQLRLFGRCDCGDDFCGTFYTAPQPSGAYGPSHRNIDLAPVRGMIILDVIDESIACVEVLNRDEIRDRLALITF